MRSTVALELSQRQRARIAAMTPAERVALALRMSREGMDSYMATHGVSRRTARAQIEATRRRGRRPSASSQADDD
jgi:Flp pilus assembly protein CpaB